MKRSKETAVYARSVPVISNGRISYVTRPQEVRVMVRAEGYAMVRAKGCAPFVVSEKDLAPQAQPGQPQEGKTHD